MCTADLGAAIAVIGWKDYRHVRCRIRLESLNDVCGEQGPGAGMREQRILQIARSCRMPFELR